MGTKDIYDRFNELSNGDKFICSKSELNDFILCGLIFEVGNKYISRNSNIKDIVVLEDLSYKMNIDFSSLLNIDLKDYGTNKVYFMTKDTYNKYKEQNLIITQNGNEYYRLFSNELWLVQFL